MFSNFSKGFSIPWSQKYKLVLRCIQSCKEFLNLSSASPHPLLWGIHAQGSIMGNITFPYDGNACQIDPPSPGPCEFPESSQDPQMPHNYQQVAYLHHSRTKGLILFKDLNRCIWGSAATSDPNCILKEIGMGHHKAPQHLSKWPCIRIHQFMLQERFQSQKPCKGRIKSAPETWLRKLHDEALIRYLLKTNSFITHESLHYFIAIGL